MLEDTSCDALNVSGRCSASVTLARPVLLETVAFGVLLACGFDEEVRVYKLSDAHRLPRSRSDEDKIEDSTNDWQWPHWQRLTGGHTCPVRDIQLSPENELRIISGGMDGQIVFWDYAAGQVEKIMDVGLPVLRFLPVLIANQDGAASKKSLVLYSLFQGWNPKSPVAGAPEIDHRVVAVRLEQKDGGLRAIHGKTILRRVLADCLSTGQNGRFVLSANRNFLLVYRTSRSHKFSHYLCDGVRCRIASVAPHPRERSAAVGLTDGRVLLVHNLFTSSRPALTQLHWHFRLVSGLAFAPDGCALYSGGGEAVLVKWDTSPEAGDKSRTFLPRLGAGVVGVTCGPSGSAAVAVALDDNSMVIVDSTMRQAGRVRGLLVGDDLAKDNAESIRHRQIGLVRDPLTECIAMAGQPGVVNFFSVSGQRHLGSVDVARANYTAVESAVVAKVQPVRVEFTAFSDRGAWLATYDRREDARYGAEMWLRLWLRRRANPATEGGSAATEHIAFNQNGEERLTEPLVGIAFQPCAGERKLVCAFADGGLACYSRTDRVQHLARPGEEAVFASHWILSRTWRLGFGFSGGPLTFDPSGRYLLTSHQSQVCASVWVTGNISSPPAVFRLNSPTPNVASFEPGAVTFCSMWDDGRSVVLCARDRMRVWNRKSGNVLTEAVLSVTSGVEDHKSGMLILLCAAERTLLMLHSCEPSQLSRIQINCPSEPLHLSVTEDTFVFLTGDRRLYVYPEPTVAGSDKEMIDAAGVQKQKEVGKPPATVSLLSHIVNSLQGRKRRDAGQALEERLRLFVESDAFAAPGLNRLVSGNLQLVRLHLLAKEPQVMPSSGSGAYHRELTRGRSFKQVGNSEMESNANTEKAETDSDSDSSDADRLATEGDKSDGLATNLTEIAFEHALCKCLRRLCNADSLLTMNHIRHQQRLERKHLRQAAASMTAALVKLSNATIEDPVALQPSSIGANAAPNSEIQERDGDSEPDLIIVSTTLAPKEQPGLPETPPPRRAKRLPNGALSVDLDEEESSSGHSSGRKRHRKNRQKGNFALAE